MSFLPLNFWNLAERIAESHQEATVEWPGGRGSGGGLLLSRHEHTGEEPVVCPNTLT